MKAIKTLIFLAMLVVSGALHAAETVVSHYEPLRGIAMHVAEPLGMDVTHRQRTSERAVLQFEALGKQFDLDLEANHRILDAMSDDAAFDGISVYRGRLADNPNSWVRITVFKGIPRGMIWDGQEMFAIEAPGDSAVKTSEPVMYRLADMSIVPGTMTCGAQTLGGNVEQYLAAVKDEVDPVSEAAGATTEITMSVIGDSILTERLGSEEEAAAAITARFNNIDGYFSEQVGVQLKVELIETHDAASDPFNPATTDPGSLLDEVSEYRFQTPAHYSRGLTHLYTGRDVTATTVGLAWLGSLCSRQFGAGFSEARVGLITDSVIAAHEIGHNFNADHDGDPTKSCPDTPEDFIMAPSVNGSQEFSACSISRMQARAASASCVTAIPAIDVGIQQNNPVADVLLGANTVIEYDVSVNGTLGVAGVVADFTVPAVLTLDSITTSTGSCMSGAGTVSCTLGNLTGQSSHTITLTTTPSAVGVGTLSASVSTSDTDERLANNLDSLQLTVDPAVDLVVNGPTTNPVFVDNSTTVSATLENVSILPATNVSLSVTLASGLRVDSASWSIGSCTVAAQQVDCTASTFAAQSSSTLSITATATALGSQNVAVSLTSDEVDANPDDNSASRAVNVVSPQSEDEDEGGGSTDPLLLLLAAFAVVLRRFHTNG